LVLEHNHDDQIFALILIDINRQQIAEVIAFELKRLQR
jgi:hypothetical protein